MGERRHPKRGEWYLDLEFPEGNPERGPWEATYDHVKSANPCPAEQHEVLSKEEMLKHQLAKVE